MKTTNSTQEKKLRIDNQAHWWSLVDWTDVPHWMQDNHHIHSGYRQASYSYIRSFASILHLHNETVNIWSHAIPALLSLPSSIFLYSILKPRYDNADVGDVVTIGIFFASAALALGMSAIYHTVSNHSPTVAKMWNQLDYAGIACLIAGSFVPCVFYEFRCDHRRQVIYWSMISILGIGCTIISVLPKFRTPPWRPVRASMFVGMGLSAIFPIFDGLHKYGFDQMRKQTGLLWVLLEGALYILGAGLYAMRWPERQAPGRFDIFGSSHQIFHILVVTAAASHLVGLLIAFDYWHRTNGEDCR